MKLAWTTDREDGHVNTPLQVGNSFRVVWVLDLCGSGWLAIPFESHWIRVLDRMCWLAYDGTPWDLMDSQLNFDWFVFALMGLHCASNLGLNGFFVSAHFFRCLPVELR